MPQAQQQQTSPDFARKADAAALAIKQSMGLPQSQVQVGPDGQQPPPLPPEGSYARAALEAARQQQPSPALRAQDLMAEPVAMPPAQQQQQPQPQQQAAQEPSSVQQRFSELTRQVRDGQKTIAELQAELAQERTLRAQAKQEADQLVRQHLDQLDPDERQRVLSKAEMLEIAQRTKQEVLDQVVPHLRDSALRERHREYQALAGRYPAFSADVHVPLIEAFLERNQACPIDQAFRAIATDEELGLRQQMPPVPSVVTGPGSRAMETMNGPPPQPDPNEALRADAKKLHELARSRNPEDRSLHRRLVQEHMKQRLGL